MPMLNSCFWIDGVCSLDMGVRLQAPVSFSAPTPKRTAVSVPGRNGDLHFWEGSFSNVEGTARCFALEPEHVENTLHASALWALLEPGYHRLEVSEEPEHFRMAAVVSGPETAIRVNRLAPFSITFDCKPQRFLKSGEETVTFETSGGVLLNPGFASLPLIRVFGSGAGTLTVGDITVQIKTLDGELDLDCETQNAYYEYENRNTAIYAPEFPRLVNGKNTVTWTGGVQRVEIIPRWWTI